MIENKTNFNKIIREDYPLLYERYTQPDERKSWCKNVNTVKLVLNIGYTRNMSEDMIDKMSFKEFNIFLQNVIAYIKEREYMIDFWLL